jgi:hypothetical protein
MQGVFPAARTVFLQFNTTRIVATIFFCRVVALSALCAFERYDRANISSSHV